VATSTGRLLYVNVESVLPGALVRVVLIAFGEGCSGNLGEPHGRFFPRTIGVQNRSPDLRRLVGAVALGTLTTAWFVD